ncbi:hypothetical protein SAMN05428969_1240 [Devosia sp. YR412]|nr:hypothetical protein SAMN05428969_1240 [Devosia sp. YR412]
MLRPDFHIIRAVHLRGLVPVLRVAVAAWWDRPRLPQDLSPRLRADMGLPPAKPSLFWPEASDSPHLSLPLGWHAM